MVNNVTRMVGGRSLLLVGVAWLVVVGVGLFVPLMDNDSAHHANIALRMYLSGDYVRLIDYDGPYLDKPHLHFWLCALSYHLFGVTGFAYKFPTLIFSLVGIWAVYRLGVLLVGESVGRVAGMVYASSVAMLLGLNDVRMDGVLTAAVAISVWQLVGFLKTRKLNYVLGAALGMAIGFSTKGYIGVFIPVLFVLVYGLFSGGWVALFNLRLLVGVLVFLLLISPVVYCYYLQFNLHPEVVVRGKDNIDGVRFILWDQTLGRYGGEMGSDAKGDRLFFFHTFMWVFAPWSLLGIISLFINRGGKKVGDVSKSVLVVLLIFALLVGFSSFKLPHYLNVILPVASLWIGEVLCASWVRIKKYMVGLEWVLWVLLGAFTPFLLIWWFPEQPVVFWVGLILFLVMLFYNYRKLSKDIVEGFVLRNISSVLVLFWLLNAAFYPSLLKYQGGNELASKKKVQQIKEVVFSLEGCYSSSFYFYTKTIRKEISINSLKNKTGYLLLDEKQIPLLEQGGVRWEKVDSVFDYEITRIKLTFLNRDSRESACNRLLVVYFKGPSV